MKDKGYVQVGLIGVGLSTYWSQFEGLLPRLLEYQSYINNRMKGAHANVIDAGMVDSPEKAAQAATLLKCGIIICFHLHIRTFFYHTSYRTTL